MLSKLTTLGQNSIIIDLESTAHYGDNLVRFLLFKDFKVCYANSLSSSSMRRNNVTKTKVDKVYTFVIAKTLMMQDSLRFISLKALEFGRFRKKMKKQHTRLKIQLFSCIDYIFPELQYFFKSGVHQKFVYALLKEASISNDIASIFESSYPSYLKRLPTVILVRIRPDN